MAKSSIVIDLDDPRSERIAEVMSNKSAKKILSLLAEGEMSASEIAGKLEVPLNTVTYNVSKLVEAGLVEKVNKIFWSSKGKRMEIYRVSNRRIVISPKKIMRGILPALIVTVFIAAIIAFVQMQNAEVQGEIATANYADDSSMKVAAPRGAEANEGNMAGTSAAGTSLAQEESDTSEASEEIVVEMKDKDFYDALENAPDSWAWYLIGALTALVIVLLWSFFRR